MSLRARLLVGLGVVALVLLGAAIIVTRATESYLIERVDAQLRSAGAPVRDNPIDPDGDGGPAPRGTFTSLWVGYVDPSGNVSTVVSPRIGSELGLPVIGADRALQAVSDPVERPFTAETDGDTRYRVIAAHAPRTGRTYLVGLPLTDVDAAVTRLITIEAVATLITLAILGLVIWWVIRLGVRPIKQMTETATAIAEGDLSHRVPEVAAGTEAGELGSALNAMLGQIEASFAQKEATEDRLRRFAADASHELRTPVTTIRGYAELYRSGALRGDGELDQAMRRTEAEAVRMGALIDDLLVLARLDEGRPLERRDVDLAVLAADAAADARATEPDRPITVAAPVPVIVQGDDHRLRQVVANLVGNAKVHTPAGTPVTIRASVEGDTALLAVADSGPGMDEATAAQAFERFYRADASRTRASGGAGLGLAIVESIARAHGGRVDITATPGGGTTVEVRIPLAGSAPEPAAATAAEPAAAAAGDA